MEIPSSVTQLLITLVLVVPGFVFQAVRIRMVGRTPADTDLPTRILRAIVASTVFAIVYVLVLGHRLTKPVSSHQSTLLNHPRSAAVAALLMALVVPIAAAFIVSFPWRDPSLRTKEFWKDPVQTWRETHARFDPRPAAWDVMFQSGKVGFVRARMADGNWYGGYFGEFSWASSFPDLKSLYVQTSYRMTKQGAFGTPVENSAGAVIDCEGAVLVELIAVPAETTE